MAEANSQDVAKAFLEQLEQKKQQELGVKPDGGPKRTLADILRELEERGENTRPAECWPAFRWLMLQIVSRKLFEHVVLVIILINCIFIALANPLDTTSTLAQINPAIELVFAILFTIELFMKTVALGWGWCPRDPNSTRPNGYLQDNWNRMDFLIVITGWITLIPGVENIGAIRIIRVLRPLRTVNKLPGLQMMIRTLLQSLSNLPPVLFLLSFIFTVFSILCVQLWNGILTRRCISCTNSFTVPGVNHSIAMISSCTQEQIALGDYSVYGWDSAGNEDEPFYCTLDVALGGQLCPINYECHEAIGENPGLFHFDNIGNAILTIFTIATLAGWADIMAWVDDAWGISFYVFGILILITSFFAVNLVLAVVFDAFAEANAKSKEEAVLAKQLARRRKEKEKRAKHQLLQLRRQESDEAAAAKSKRASQMAIRALTADPDSDALPPLAVLKAHKTMTAEELQEEIDMEEDMLGFTKEEWACFELMMIGEGVVGGKQALTDQKFQMMQEERQKRFMVEECVLAGRQFVDLRRNYHAKSPAWFLTVFKLVESKVFMWFITIAIVLNTIVLATEHHNQIYAITALQTYGNYVFTVLFFVEVVLKLIAYGPRVFAMDKFNVFDAFIVTMSVLELLATAIAGPGALSALGALRAFRLLRIFKLAKAFKSLQALLGTVGRSMEQIGYISMLVTLFVFMFGVTGVQLFAEAFDKVSADERPRADYHNLWWSCVTVFQVLTGDDWTALMEEATVVAGALGLIFYLVLTLLGSYIIINMFVSIILSGFENEDAEMEDRAVMVAMATAKFREMWLAGIDWVTFRERVYIRELTKHVNERKSEEEAEQRERAIKRAALGEGMAGVPCEGKALGCIPPENRVRRFCFALIISPIFENIVLALICLNCAALAMDQPDGQGWLSPRVLAVLDLVFIVFFTLEMIVKIIGVGLFKGDYGYLKDGWNKLDCFVVITSLISLGFPQITFIRAFRGLRPLRVVVRSPRIKVVMMALFMAVPGIVNVFIFCTLMWLIFGILGVSLFKGSLGFCPDAEGGPLLGLNKVDCPDAWSTPPWNFDNIGIAMLTLFQVASMSGWGEIMYACVDSVGPDMGPVDPAKNNQPWVPIFFILYILFCSFFALNLFIGVVIDTFNSLKDEFSGSALMTTDQQEWMFAHSFIASIKLIGEGKMPRQKIRAVCYRLVRHPAFDIIIMIFILLNTATMASQHFQQTASWTTALEVCNYVFVVIFTTEMILKMIGLGYKDYFKDPWNRFDFVMVLVAYISIAAAGNAALGTIRVFRVGRVFRLIKRAKVLNSLFGTLMHTLPSLYNIGSLIFVVFFIFAIVGIEFFGSTNQTDGGLSVHANYQTFGVTFVTLFRMATGDGWEEMMYGTALTDGEDCDSVAAPGSCGSSVASPIFHVLFMIVGALVMVELYTAVVLENFSERTKEQDTIYTSIAIWKDVWEELDPRSCGVLRVEDFLKVMMKARQPFGFQGDTNRARHLWVFRLCQLRTYLEVPPHSKDNIPVWCVHFNGTILKLVSVIQGLDTSTAPDGNEEVDIEDVTEEVICQYSNQTWTRTISVANKSKLSLVGASTRTLSVVSAASNTEEGLEMVELDVAEAADVDEQEKRPKTLSLSRVADRMRALSVSKTKSSAKLVQVVSIHEWYAVYIIQRWWRIMKKYRAEKEKFLLEWFASRSIQSTWRNRRLRFAEQIEEAKKHR